MNLGTKISINNLINEIRWFSKSPVKDIEQIIKELEKQKEIFTKNPARLHCPHGDDFFDPCISANCRNCKSLQEAYPNVNIKKITKKNQSIVVMNYDDRRKDVIPEDWVINKKGEI